MSFRSLVKAVIPRQLFKKIEPYGHLGEAVLINTLNGFPSRGLKVIGVTGTNGKSTTCFLIHKMMHEAGYKVGLMTTIAYGAGMDIKPQDEHMTTSSVPKTLKRIKYLKSQGIEWLVLETTSQGLAQHRVWGVPYSIAVMTNVTHEHLDYHGTFENYRAAKIKLFELTNKNRGGLRTGVINADDPAAELFAKAIKHPITYGVKGGELKATDIKSSATGSEFSVSSSANGNLKLRIKTHLPGTFNIHNSLAAVGVGLALGIEPGQIEQGIASLKQVEGRMNSIDEGQGFSVIVDYAHTPDSFEKLFKDLEPNVKGKLIVMFGSAGGQRDPAKRPIQGEIAGKYADEIILTEEDDRNTPGMQILDEIATGAEKAGKQRDKNLFLVHDRTKAIEFTIGLAKDKDDVVLLLGKGHEKTIDRAGGEEPWDEVKTARTAIHNRLK